MLFRLLAGPGIMAVGVATVLAAQRASDVAGATVGMAAAGGSALLTGLIIIGVAWWHGRTTPGEGVRALLGLATLLWGIGQVALAVESAGDGGRTFGPGDMCGSLGAPLVALALLRMPRTSRASRPALRLALDAVLLASTATLAIWWFLLFPALPNPAAPGPDAVAATSQAFFDVLVAALTALVWIRDRRQGAGPLFVGAGLQAVADVASLPAVLSSQLLPWQSGVIWCVAWPVIGLGLMRIGTTRIAREPESVLEDLGESRSTSLATVISIGLMVAVLAVPFPRRWAGIGGVLLVAVIVVAASRELLGTRIRSRLITQLGAEALRDVLTGLPNRLALTGRIRVLDLHRPWVLLNVDLDGFKEVNDLLGHEAGDDLIIEVGRVLAEHCPPAGMLARIGGDEYGVLAPGDARDGERLAERLAAAIRTSPSARSGGVVLSASIGVGRVLPDNPESLGVPPTPDPDPVTETGRQLPPLLDARHDRMAALIESAAALRAAKAAGRDRVAVYPGAVERARQRRLVLEWRLREALAEGRLRMHAQPLVDLQSGRVRGFESLARWHDDVLGQVSPAEFVPVAEQSGLVMSLGEFALRSTLEEARAAGVLGCDVEVGVNVSPIQLRLPQFAARVADLVEELGLRPDRLLLEVTEAILVDEDDPAAGTLAELAAAGVRLAIDDFGTGYSALGYLRRLPLDVLKIDRSWVVDSVSDRRTRHIVSGVVDLAHQLGATVVMEGIEDVETADMCRAVGADVGQGWLFGRPQPWPVAALELQSRPRQL